MATLLLSDLDARRTFDAYNVLRRVAHDVDARVMCAEERPRTSSPYGPTRRLRLGSQATFGDDLRALAAAHDGPLVVIPASEALLERLLEARGAASDAWPSNVRALLPSRASFERACDKGELPSIARDARVHTPALVPPPWTRAELVARLPLVAKPRNGRGGVGVRHLVTAEDVDTHVAHLDPARDLVMERLDVTRAVHGAFFLYEDGRCVAQYGHERVRTFPASGGVSTCAVRRDVDEVQALGRAVLDALQWSGLAMIEAMRRTAPSADVFAGGWSLVEINTRLWGTILLDEFSGAFLLRNYVRRCLDLPLAPQAPQAPQMATTFRWAAGEALHAAQTREARSLVANPLDADTCWSGVTYARPGDAARFFARAAVSPENVAKLKSKWAGRTGR